jgi:hypothetical protein
MSWYSNLLTNASTNITKLQRNYFGGENDGDTEDDTHVCRVLRSYYTEKGQPFPGWLPPDPKAPPPVQPVFATQNQVGSRYGGLGNNNYQQGGGAASTGKLGSLWDNSNNNQPSQPASLRQGGRPSPFARDASPAGGGQGRPSPLPSQRAGSYQSQQQANPYGRNDTRTPPGGSSGGSAQDKLKQKLWGGSKTASPSSGGPFQPPAPQQSQSSSRWGSNSGSSGGGNYEDRFAPAGAYGNEQPVMSANAPWSGGDMDYYSGGPDYGGGGGGTGGRRSAGLPSGPKRGGLPSGPRMR